MTRSTHTDEPRDTRRLVRIGALAGVAFAALIVVIRFMEGAGLPDATESTAKVVAYWTDHRDQQMAVSVIASFAGVAFLWFAGTLRSVQQRAEGGTAMLANVAFGGAVLAAVGILANTTVEFTAAHTAGHVPAQVTQTLSALQADTFFPIAAGFGIWGIAAGLSTVRTGALPTKLGWLSVVGGALWLSPGEFIAIALTLAYAVAAGILIYRREGRAEATVAEPTPVGV